MVTLLEAHTHLHDALPPARPATHAQRLLELPSFPSGTEADRLERARAYLRGSRALIEQWRQEMAGLSVSRLLTRVHDTLVQGLFAELTQGEGGLALVALGGYGRRELSPGSDLDLLLLRHPRAKDAWVKPLAAAFSTTLWDLKLTVGWSVRTRAECVQAAREDHSIATAFLDRRLLCGEAPLYAELDAAMKLASPEDFVTAKVAELRGRREKYGDSVFVLEPHLKQGEGGLRDLESALWIAQAHFGTRGLGGLIEASALPPGEVETLRAARDFLLRTRHQLHAQRQRKEDRLTFELQELTAEAMGYAGPGQPEGKGEGAHGAVERFMRHYYLAAQTIRRSADALVARWEEHRDARGLVDEALGEFRVTKGRLATAGAPHFVDEPAAILRLLRLTDARGLPLHSATRDAILQALPALSAARAQPEIIADLKALFTDVSRRGRTLWLMHELGVLGALLPEFGRVTALHQHDLYHVYTVDVHSLFALQRLHALRAGDLVHEEPELSRWMRDLADPLPLYLGMLFHDAGKGMGGSHSLRGQELMAAVGTRLGLSERQREVAQMLVLDHLLMSHTSQRRDLTDPDLIEEFARRVGDVEKLTALYLLSYADISSVGPRMWTAWKAQLLRELHEKTRDVLLHGRGAARHPSDTQDAFVQRWTRAFGAASAAELAQVFNERYFLSTEPERATLHARLKLRARQRTLAAARRALPGSQSTELTLCTPDRHGLLSQLTGVLAAHGMQILSARIVSTRDGFALDVFELRGPSGGPLEAARWRRARADLVAVLAGQADVGGVLARRDHRSVLARHLPRVSTQVSVDNRASQHHSVVDVRAEDRVGLLHALTSALAELGLEISFAKVLTEANRALDSFYVTRGGAKLSEPEVMEAVQARMREAAG